MAARDRVVVVGAGVAGLSSAIELARSGFAVTVVERAARSGGKLREAEAGGIPMDAGPTVLTMKWVFEEIFEAAGASLDRALSLSKAELLARHAWGDGARLDLFADLARSADAVGAFAGPSQAAGYLRFCAESQGIYETLRTSFLTAQKTGPAGLSLALGARRWRELLALRPFETLWGALGRHFHDPRLRQLFGRYATYCGSSPFQAPATLMLIAHVEQAGVWLVRGGMQRLAEALEQLAASKGAVFRFSSRAAEICLERGRVAAVRLEGGERIAADFVVCNADPAALAAGELGPQVQGSGERRPAAGRSLSAATWSLSAETSGFALSRHNVFFSDDYKAEFDHIFRQRRLPRAPTVYVCAHDRVEASDLASGRDRLLVLVNAPADGDRPEGVEGGLQQSELEACERRVFHHLSRCGLQIGAGRETQVAARPQTFEAMFPATGGALYGRAVHGWRAAFQRPGAQTKIPGLYLAGGGAHPGAGVPMAALSGRLAAQRLIQDQASTRPSRREAMPGGTSTPSAPTAATA